MTHWEGVELRYMFVMAMMFLGFAKKPTDFAKFAGKMIAWWLFPILLVVFLIVGYVSRNQMRWYKDVWGSVTLKHFFNWMIYGMTGLTKRYG